MGLEPGTTKAQVRKCLEDWNKGDNGILDLSQAYRLKPGSGWLIGPCILHAPGLALHVRAAVGQRRVRHVPVARRRPRGAVGAAGEGHAQGEAPGPRLHRRAARLGSERRPVLQGEPLPRADRRTPARTRTGFVDKWIVYGKVRGEQLFTAKELTVNPGQKATIKDNGANGIICVQGEGRINKLRLSSPKMIGFHELTEDEVFVTESAAKAGVTFENTSGDRAAGRPALLRPGSEPGRAGASSTRAT